MASGLEVRAWAGTDDTPSCHSESGITLPGTEKSLALGFKWEVLLPQYIVIFH